MSNQDIFNSPNDNIRIVAGEIRELKELVREISSRLARIEARVKRALPTAPPIANEELPSETFRDSSGGTVGASERALQLYDQLVMLFSEGRTEEAKRKLAAYDVFDLKLMRREKGVSLGRKKPSRAVLMEAICGRLQQSAMLLRSTRAEQPRGVP